MRYQKTIETPIGLLRMDADEEALLEVKFVDQPADECPNELLLCAERQLQEYFAGERRKFTLPLKAQGTLFQQHVWDAIRTVDYGMTTTYGALAKQIGRPSAARVVGMAAGRNPLWIVIPCHRVIGADGSLTGYAGGVERKAFLLELERRNMQENGQNNQKK